MNVPTVIAIIGGVLFLVGLIGGGIEIREAKMPQLSFASRAFAMLLGLAFVGSAAFLSTPASDLTPAPFSVSPPSSAQPQAPQPLAQPAPAPRAAPAPVPRPASDTGSVQLLVASSSTKQAWMEKAAAAFQAARVATAKGRLIAVRVQSVSSGGSLKDILAGRLKPVVWSPGSEAWVEQLNAEWRQGHGKPLVGGACPPVIYSPLGFAMWRPMAEALGWPDRPVGWKTLVELAADPQGWSRYGHAEWGRFHLGHAHPKYGNSGLLTMTSFVYGMTGKTDTLSAREVYEPGVEKALRTIAGNTAKYGVVTEDLVDLMARQGPAYLHAVATYESDTVRMNLERARELRFPVAFVFPAEGTFWGGHPYCILDQADWVSPDQAEAAVLFRDFLLSEAQQDAAIDALLRPLDERIPLRAPLDLAHGTDPRVTPRSVQPLPDPNAELGAAVIDLFMLTKRKATLMLVIDTSNSMAGEKMQAATTASAEFLRRLQGDDVAGLMAFGTEVKVLTEPTRFAEVAEELPSRVLGLVAAGNTALHEAVCEATRLMQARQAQDRQAGDNRMYGIVLLSDGADTKGRPTENQMFATCLPANAEAEGIRIFPIAFGKDANTQVLKRIADASGGKLFTANPESIDKVYLGISAEQ